MYVCVCVCARACARVCVCVCVCVRVCARAKAANAQLPTPARFGLLRTPCKLTPTPSVLHYTLEGRGTEEDALQGRYEHSASAAGAKEREQIVYRFGSLSEIRRLHKIDSVMFEDVRISV